MRRQMQSEALAKLRFVIGHMVVAHACEPALAQVAATA